MKAKDRSTAGYRVITDSGGSRYRFYCDASGMALCTTSPIRKDTQEEELQTAWETEGKRHFNWCSQCGRWVSDPMYNADTLHCVDCTPWQRKPNYCTRCGRQIPAGDLCCRTCGTSLRYGEVTG